MSYVKGKMHKIRFWLGFCPRPCCGSLQRSLDTLAGFKTPISKGTGGNVRGRDKTRLDGDGRGKGGGKEGKGKVEREGRFLLNGRLHGYVPDVKCQMSL